MKHLHAFSWDSTTIVRLLSAGLAAIALQAVPARAALDQPACERLKASRAIGAQAPVGCERLAVVRFSYVDFAGTRHDDGELMVLDAVAPEVGQLFNMLRQRGFALAQARLVDHYGGDDDASMRDNNTSAFNHRPITGGGPPSLHAYGLAIDVNPIQNPFLQPGADGAVQVSPPAGTAYLNRRAVRPGKPRRAGMAEEVVDLFAAAGFSIWGGDWDAPLDYQHFQFNRELAQRLATLPAPAARRLYMKKAASYRDCLASRSGRTGMACAYVWNR